MAPQSTTATAPAAPTTTTTTTQQIQKPLRPREKESQPKLEIIWRNVIALSVLHAFGVYAFYVAFTQVMWWSFVFTLFHMIFLSLGVTAGAHRLWAHRAYKAKLPLRTFLMFLNASSAQTPIYEWVRDHRVHHKFSETDADPHNAKRGFFFAHMGWLMCKKHPEVRNKGKSIDLSDILADPVAMFQYRFHYPLTTFCCFVLPTIVPHYMYGETYWNAYCMVIVRYILSLHFTWLVNSAAHIYGNRPYDTKINPRENRLVALLSSGEGYHNYHHTFPWDYSTSELGWKINFTTMFLDCMHYIGQAYDLKTVPKDIVSQRKLKNGDGSYGHPHGY